MSVVRHTECCLQVLEDPACEKGMVLVHGVTGERCQLAGPWSLHYSGEQWAFIKQCEKEPAEMKWVKEVLTTVLAKHSNGQLCMVTRGAAAPQWLEEANKKFSSRYAPIMLPGATNAAYVKVYRTSVPLAGCQVYWQVRDIQELA